MDSRRPGADERPGEERRRDTLEPAIHAAVHPGEAYRAAGRCADDGSQLPASVPEDERAWRGIGHGNVFRENGKRIMTMK